MMGSPHLPSRPPGPAAVSASRRTTALACGLLVLAVFAAYSNSLTGPFVFDDKDSIVNNFTLRHLWPPSTVLAPLGGGLTVSGRPALNLSFALNFAVGGLDVRGYHGTNILISEAARGVEQLSKGEALHINLKEEKVRCPKCNRLLPEKDGICPACEKRGRTLIRIMRFMLPYKWHAISLTSLSFLTTVLYLAPPYIQGNLIDGVLKTHKNLHMLWSLMILWLCVVALGSAMQIISGRITAFLAGHIAADLRSAVYRAIEFLQLTFFDKKQVGAISSRVTQDTDRIWNFLTEGIPFFLLNGLQLIGIIVFLFISKPLLAACILAPVPIVMATSALIWKSMSRMFHKVGQKWARFHMHLN